MTNIISKYQTFLAKTTLICGIVFLFLTMSGCPSKLSPIPEPLTRQQGLDLYNANVKAVPPFKATILQWKAEFPDEQGELKKHEEWGGNVLYHPFLNEQSPARFYLKANAPGKEALVLGSNEKEFWMYSKWGNYGLWGKHKHQGKPCARKMLIPPQLILEFIGLAPLPEQPPYPVYKVNPQTNIIEYVAEDDEGYSCRREIIIDRRSNLPTEINAYNRNGQKIMHSTLKNYQTLDRAHLPADILLSWPKEKSFIHLRLFGFKVDEKDRSKLFIRPVRIPGIDDYQQIDLPCEDE